MVALNLVKESNARLHELGPGLVALFVGATSGIGEITAKAFVQNTISPRVYLVGRNAPAAERIIEECKALNKDGKVEFIKADVSELKEVDRVCKEIQSKEKHLNLLVQTQGNLNFRGRDESPEGLDRKLVLNFYSRMRFTSNLLPLLHTASTNSPSSFSRAVSILAAGTEGKINIDDLELKDTFSTGRCANHSVVMNDFMAEEYAARQPGTTFMHGFPLVVDTGVTRELPLWARIGARALMTIFSPLAVSVEETAQRQSFHATSAIYPPRNLSKYSKIAAGVSFGDGLALSEGADEKPGSGAYLTHWNGDAIKQKNLLREYRQQGYGKIIWDHTMGIFDRVEKKNAGTS